MTTNYAYDFENRLSSVGTVGGSTTSYAYDGSGNRLSVTNNVGQANVQTTRFLNDVNRKFAQVVEEQDGSGTALVRYLYGAGNGLIRQQRLAINSTPASTSYYLTDGLSSTRQLSDSAGSVTDSSYYDAYGNGLAGNTSSTSNSYGFNGQQKDDATGGYFLRARYYAPSTGRFLSQDPFGGDMGRPSSLHRYNYSHGDPVNYSDPGGKDEIMETVEVMQDGVVAEGIGSTSVEEIPAIAEEINEIFGGATEISDLVVIEETEDAILEAAVEDLTEPLELPEEMPDQEFNPPQIDTEDANMPWYKVSLTGIPLYTTTTMPPMPVTANHIFSAIMGLGEPMQPMVLTRLYEGDRRRAAGRRRTIAQKWYRKQYGDNPYYPLNTLAPNLASPGSVIGTWDEYPFASTAECGISKQMLSPFFPATSVWLTPSSEYPTQGSDVSTFYGRNNLGQSSGRFGVMVLP